MYFDDISSSAIINRMCKDINVKDIGRDFRMADLVYEKVMVQIRDFEAVLDKDHEVGIALAAFGAPTVMAVESLGYQNPDILYFYGVVNGRPAQLIQHVSQLNFLLTSVDRTDPTKPPRRIGFERTAEE